MSQLGQTRAKSSFRFSFQRPTALPPGAPRSLTTRERILKPPRGGHPGSPSGRFFSDKPRSRETGATGCQSERAHRERLRGSGATSQGATEDVSRYGARLIGFPGALAQVVRAHP